MTEVIAPAAGLLAVRPQCPECHGLHVPAYRAVVVSPGKWLMYRKCSECGKKFKGMELSADVATAEGRMR